MQTTGEEDKDLRNAAAQLQEKMSVERAQKHINGLDVTTPRPKQEAVDRLFALHFKARVELSLHRKTKPSIPFKGAHSADLLLTPPTPTQHLFFLIVPAPFRNFMKCQGSGSIFVPKTLKIEQGRPDVH